MISDASKLCTAFKIESCEQLYTVKTVRKVDDEIAYYAYQVLANPDIFHGYLADIRSKYVDGPRPCLMEKTILNPYRGMAVGEGEIFYIPVADRIVKDCYQKLVGTLVCADREHTLAATSDKTNALVMRVKTAGGGRVLLISVHPPFVTLKHRFYHTDNEFKALDKAVLTLSTNIDAVVCDETIYFLTLAGAQFFIADGLVKQIANRTVVEITKESYVSGAECLRAVAQKGINPRRLLAFNRDSIEALRKPSIRKSVAEKFGIQYARGKFELSIEADAEKFIKIVCDRGMLDPFKLNPVEVTGSQKWR